MLCFQYWLHNFTAVFCRMARFESHYLLSRHSQTFSVFFCQLSVDLKCNIILQNISEINLLFIICQVGSKNSLQNYTRNLCMALSYETRILSEINFRFENLYVFSECYQSYCRHLGSGFWSNLKFWYTVLRHARQTCHFCQTWPNESYV